MFYVYLINLAPFRRKITIFIFAEFCLFKSCMVLDIDEKGLVPSKFILY